MVTNNIFSDATGPAGTDSGGNALTECCNNCKYFRASADHDYTYKDELADDPDLDVTVTSTGVTDHGVCRYWPPPFYQGDKDMKHERRPLHHKNDWCRRWSTSA